MKHLSIQCLSFSNDTWKSQNAALKMHSIAMHMPHKKTHGSQGQMGPIWDWSHGSQCISSIALASSRYTSLESNIYTAACLLKKHHPTYVLFKFFAFTSFLGVPHIMGLVPWVPRPNSQGKMGPVPWVPRHDGTSPMGPKARWDQSHGSQCYYNYYIELHEAHVPRANINVK